MAKNNNNTPQTRHVYFALDSDVLTNLADLDYLRKKYPEDKEIYQLRDKVDHSKQRSLSFNFNFYNELLNIAKSGDVRFLITPTAFFECKHIPYLLGFIKKYCYVPKLSIANYKHQEYLVRELAKTYCNDYYIDEINENGEVVSVKHKAPLSPEYNAHYGDLVPSNDAYIMAEATVFNAVLLTENGKLYALGKISLMIEKIMIMQKKLQKTQDQRV